jgi:Mor family transcriptional regulator
MRRRDRNILVDLSHGLPVREIARRRRLTPRAVYRVIAAARARFLAPA